MTYKNPITIMAITSITISSGSQKSVIKKEIADILKINSGDEILFILDKTHINIRKYPTPLKSGEKFLSSSTIGSDIILKKGAILEEGREARFRTYISRDVINILELDENRKILWILDKDSNIIIRNVFLSSICTKYLIGRDISAMVITFTEISPVTTVPVELIDILDLYSTHVIKFGLDEFDNIIVNNPKSKLLGNAAVYHKNQKVQIYFDDNILRDLKIAISEKIIWILDEDGNIIIKSNILPNRCK